MNAQSRDWKGTLREVAIGLNLRGFAAVSWHPDRFPRGVWLNTTPESDLLVFPGRGLDHKAVRTALWQWRKNRSLLRHSGFLWAAYDSAVDLTAVGVGSVVSPAVATRMAKRSETFVPLGAIPHA